MLLIDTRERPMSETTAAPSAFSSGEGAEEPAYTLDGQIGFLLRQAQQRHTSIFARMMLEDVTPTQWATLAKLHEIGGCSQNLLGRHVAMDAATIKGVVDRLLTRGLIVTSADPTDNRRLTIDLSERGHDFVQRALPVSRAITDETVAPLDPAERDLLLSLLARIR